MLLSLRNFVVFELTSFLPRICFSMSRLEPSKNLSFKAVRLAQSVERCSIVIAWLWHSSHLGTGRPSIKYPWFSIVCPSLSLLITVLSFLHLIFSFNDPVSDLIFLSSSSFSFYCVPFFTYGVSYIQKRVLLRACYHFFLWSWCFFGFFFTTDFALN